MTDDNKWSPDKDAALKALIRETVKGAGAMSADAIPHQIKEQIRAHASGDIDVEAYVAKVLAEIKKAGS